MSITAVITNHDYGRYLRKCLDSAAEFCDEVLVYDDGSTDDSLSIIAEYPSVNVVSREGASGDPVWGSNHGIQDATSTHLIFLDSDNWLVARPPETDAEYTFCDLISARDDESFIERQPFGSLSDAWATCRTVGAL